MPPKKKKGKKGKGGKKKGSKDGELTEEDKLKMRTHEVGALKDHLAFRKEYARKTKSAFEDLRQRLDDTNVQVEEIESTHKASNAYLTHQYKTMQADLSIKMHQLETELIATRKRLESTEGALANAIDEKKRIVRDKDERINELESKIDNIQISYDSIIQSTFDDYLSNLNLKKSSWETKSTQLQAKNKQFLAQLGLRIHDI